MCPKCGKPYGKIKLCFSCNHPNPSGNNAPPSTCLTCGRPQSTKRKRCYTCSPGRTRDGENRVCIECGKSFYMQRNQVQLTNKGSGKYCSVSCKNSAMTGVVKVVGSKYVRSGYVMVKTGLRKYEQEHRVVMAGIIGRPLLRSEQVHHINGDGLDNRPENLELWTTSHPPGQRIEDKVKWAREFLAQYGEMYPET